jgi:pimeloyl-ACP methyl ester carboxylesterase
MAEQTMRPPALSGITPAMLRAWMDSSPLRDGSDPDTAAAILGGNFEDDGTGAGTLRPRLSLEHHMEIAHHLFDANGFELMAKVRCPILFIPAGHPDHEDSPKVRSMAQVREVLGDRARIVWIDGVHDLPVQRPVEVAAAIAGFVEEITSQSRGTPGE